MKLKKINVSPLLILLLIFATYPAIAADSDEKEEEKQKEEVVTGRLKVTSSSDADIYVNGTHEGTGYISIKVPIGSHIVVIEQFGWESVSERVVVRKYGSAQLDLRVREKSTFRFFGFSASPQKFSPENPGRFGETYLIVEVTAPGTGVLKIRDQNGNLVFQNDLWVFDNWSDVFSWDGHNMNGDVLPEGIYTAYITIKPEDGWALAPSHAASEFDKTSSTNLSSKVEIIIDNSLFYPLGTLATIGTATGSIPTARLLPEGTHFFAGTNVYNFTLPPHVDFAGPMFMHYAFTPLSWLEVSFNLGVEVLPESDISFLAGSSLKFASKIEPFYFGGLLRYTYASSPTQTHSFTEPGLATGFFAGIEAGSVFFSISEEVSLDPELGISTPLEGHLKTGLSVSFQPGLFSLNTWGALYSPFNAKGIKAFDMVSCGLDFSVFMFGTSWIYNMGAIYTYNQALEHDIGIRLGLGALFF